MEHWYSIGLFARFIGAGFESLFRLAFHSVLSQCGSLRQCTIMKQIPEL